MAGAWPPKSLTPSRVHAEAAHNNSYGWDDDETYDLNHPENDVEPPSRSEEYWNPPHLYHGTSVELKPGDTAERGHPSNFDKPKGRLDHAYATPQVSTAAGYAETAAYRRGGHPRVYEVDRAHDMMPDPEQGAAFGISSESYSHPDWRSKSGFRVIRELHPSEFEHHLTEDWPGLGEHTAARTAVRTGEPGSDHGLPEDASQLGTVYHSTPFKSGFPYDDWMHVGTRAAAEDRAHAIHPKDFGLPDDTPVYMHSMRLRGRVYPKVISDDWANDIASSGYTDEIDEGWPSGRGYHVFPYKNTTEGRAHLSYLVHKSAIDPHGREELQRPESNPAYHNMGWQSLHSREHLHVVHGSAWMPSSGIFGPTTGLDPLLFDQGGMLRPQVRHDLMTRLDQCLRVNSGLAGSDWQEWLHVYLAGGSASEWAGSRPNEQAQDLDVIVAIDLPEAQGCNAFEGMNGGEAASALNAAFWKRFNIDGWQPEFGGRWNLTAFCNQRAQDGIEAIKPYAAYDVTGMRWAVQPPHLPEHTVADFEPAVIAHARAVAAEARAILRMPEPLRTREARDLWEHVHQHRCVAFSEEGTGWDDPGNVDDKWLQYARNHVWGKIRDLAMAKTAEFNSWADGDPNPQEMVPLDDLHGVASMNHPGHTIGEVWENFHPEDEVSRWHGDEDKAEEGSAQAGLRSYAEQHGTIPGHLTTCKHGRVLEDGEHRYMAARDAGLEAVPVVRARSCLMPELHDHQQPKTAAAEGRGWWKLYHGTNREFSPGDTIDPGHGRPGSAYTGPDVYASDELHKAIDYAHAASRESGGHPVVYQVDPVGTATLAREENAWQSGEPLKVVSEAWRHGAGQCDRWGCHVAAAGTQQNPPCHYCGEPLDDEDVRDGHGAHEECSDMRWCEACEEHHDSQQEAEDHNEAYTDWGNHLPFSGGIHRGITVRLPPDTHSVVHDEARPAAERAAALARHLHDNPADDSDERGHAGGYGLHWTDHEPIAQAWGSGQGAMFGPLEEERHGPAWTHVVMHAASPDEDHIETDPRVLSARNLLGFDHGRSEREVPLRASAPVRLTGVSWKPASSQEWEHHDFSDASPKTASWDSSGSDHSGVYLRFGDWPHDERSFSPAGGYHEEGVSVYDLDREGDPAIDHGLDRGHEHDEHCDEDCYLHEDNPDNDPREEMHGRVARAERARYYGSDKPSEVGHLVRGEMTGVGYDGEPLLENVKRVGDWIDHRHLFLDQAKPHRLARHPLHEDYEEPEEKPPYGYRNRTAAVTVTASTDELPGEQEGLYWRAHVRKLPFDAEHAWSKPVGPGNEDSTDVRRGYSSFSNPYHLAQYMPEFFGEDSNHRNVIAFHGHHVGTGTDGEPLVVPEADHSCCGRVVHDQMPWHEFERRAWDTGHHPDYIEPGPWESRPWLRESVLEKAAAYDPDGRLARTTADLGWGDEEWAAARREPWHAAAKLAQDQVRLDHPKLVMDFPRGDEGDRMVGRLLRHTGYQGDVSGAFAARHPNPGAMTSNPSWLRGQPGVALHPDRWDYGTVAHECAHHAVMEAHGVGPNEEQPDEQVHGPEWAGHYAQGLNRISKGTGDDFLAHHQFYRDLIHQGLQWKRPSDMDAADERWRNSGESYPRGPRPQQSRYGTGIEREAAAEPTYLHGGPNRVEPGGLIHQDAMPESYGRLSHNFFTTNRDVAEEAADMRNGLGHGWVHTVEPTGPFEVDPGEPDSWKSEAPLRVLSVEPGRLNGKSPHPPILREAAATSGVPQRPKRTPGNAMVYLDVPHGTVEPYEGMETGHHVALAYLPRKIGDEDFARVVDRAREAAARHAPMKATISGGGIFPPGTPPDRRRAAVVPVHAPGIHELHREFKDFDRAHYEAYTPHVTRAQLGGHQADPPAHPEVSFPVTHVHVRRGDEVHSFPLTGPSQREAVRGEQGPLTYYHGYGREGRALTGIDDWDNAGLFVSHDPDVARLYGPHLDRIEMTPGTSVKSFIGQPGKAVENMRKARDAGFDVVEFHKPHDFIGHIILNPDKIARREPLQDIQREAVSGYDGLTDRSAMIYLDLPPGTVRQVPGGVDDAHVTICYLGKNVSDEAFEEACRRTKAAAAKLAPMDGVLRGIDVFPPSKGSDGKVVAFVPAYIGSVGLLRRELEDLSASEHKDYRPHVTLAYLEEGDSLPAPHPAVPLRFTRVHVKRGDDVVSFPLTGSGGAR